MSFLRYVTFTTSIISSTFLHDRVKEFEGAEVATSNVPQESGVEIKLTLSSASFSSRVLFLFNEISSSSLGTSSPSFICSRGDCKLIPTTWLKFQKKAAFSLIALHSQALLMAPQYLDQLENEDLKFRKVEVVLSSNAWFRFFK